MKRVLIAALSMLAATEATAAPRWVDRHLTLPRHDWSFDVGLGIAHRDPGPRSIVGPGLSFEGAVGLTERMELGFRGGIRLGDDARVVQADYYGRLFDRQTFGTRFDTFSNPEVRFRGALVRGEVFELALEGRAVAPFEGPSQFRAFSAMFGVPMIIHAGRQVRLDFGPYIPTIFYGSPIGTYWAVSFPFDVWIQVSEKVWLGPMTGIRHDVLDNTSNTTMSLGFGVGVQLSRGIDFKSMILWPAISETNGGRNLGAGVGFQFRIE
jgi:hypothetical protein